MELYRLVAILLVATFLVSYLNIRYLRLPQTIGLMLVCVLFSLGTTLVGTMSQEAVAPVTTFMAGIDFNEALMVGMLGFLLFSGSLRVNLDDLREKKWEVASFAVLSTLISVGIIGALVRLFLPLIGIPISFTYALLFGALISPTDPVAVMGALRQAKAPKSLEIKIGGESLFNDGVGVALFIGLREAVVNGQPLSAGHLTGIFLSEALGGIALGFALGYLTYRALKTIDNFQVEIVGTIALVMGLYTLCEALHLSGPLAVVAAGILIGNHGRSLAMSEMTRRRLDDFWELIDEILNAILFVLVGLVLLAIGLNGRFLLVALAGLPLVLGARFLSVLIPVMTLRRLGRPFTKGIVKIMTWGGLRGGISLALALSLPSGSEKDLFLVMTYMVVAFSIIVQGLTIKTMIARQLAE
ncbi:sodium:proton antiporter [Candidatus Uhrbacteria bacterium]|nr:sodium:proton antiporter [Candidatus Uhrbacteria bacterium]